MLLYAHMVGALSTNSYQITMAKWTLLRAYSKTQYARYQAILQTPRLGNQKPSELLQGILANLDPEEVAATGPLIY